MNFMKIYVGIKDKSSDTVPCGTVGESHLQFNNVKGKITLSPAKMYINISTDSRSFKNWHSNPIPPPVAFSILKNEEYFLFLEKKKRKKEVSQQNQSSLGRKTKQEEEEEDGW